jgi:polysaccharide biosynthesis protein PslE
MIRRQQRILKPAPASRGILASLRRHRGKGAFWFIAVITATAAVILYWPRGYRSEAKLFVRLGRESVSLDPTATMGQTIAVSESRENEINSILEVLKSRDVAERAVDMVGPELILNSSNLPTSSLPRPKWLNEALEKLPRWDAMPVSDHERAVTRLENSLEVWTPKRTSVIGVRCLGATPEAAQRVVAAVLEAYRGEHVRLHRSDRSYGFFDEQKRLLQDKLRLAHDELRDAKNRVGLASIESQQLTIQDQIRAIEAQSVASQSELAASEVKVGALKRALDTVPARLVTQDVVGFPNQAADFMRDSLFKLQATQSEMQSRYTAEHPLMIAMNEQIKRLQTTLDEQPKQRTQSTTAVHPGHQQLELSWLSEQANLASLQARVKKLDAEHLLAIDRVKDLNAKESGVAQAQRQVDLLEASYRTYSEKLELARIDQQLETEQISNVSILQPATYVAKAASPNRPLVGGLGLILAVAGSVLICLLADYSNHSLKTPDEVEKSLDLPVLISIPRLARESMSWSRLGKGIE